MKISNPLVMTSINHTRFLWSLISSISIEVNRTVFVYIYFFIKDILNVKKTQTKAPKLTFNQIFI